MTGILVVVTVPSIMPRPWPETPAAAAAILAESEAGIEAVRGPREYALIGPLMHLAIAREGLGELPSARENSERAAALSLALLGSEHRFSIEAAGHRDRIAALP